MITGYTNPLNNLYEYFKGFIEKVRENNYECILDPERT